MKPSLKLGLILFVLLSLGLTASDVFRSNPQPVLPTRYSLTQLVELKNASANASPSASPAVHPTASPVKTATVSEIAKYLSNDEVCRLVRHSYDPHDLNQALIERIQSPVLRSLFDASGPMQGAIEPNSNHPVILFYNALLYANLIEGITFPQADYHYSMTLLDALSALEPENGAVYVYQALVLDILGETPDQQRKYLVRAFHATKYNSHLTEIVKTLQAELIQNPTLWLASIELIGTMPVPKAPLIKLVQKLYPDPTAEEAQMIAQFGLHLNQDPSVFAVEYTQGKKLYEKYKQAGDQTHVTLRVLPNDVYHHQSGGDSLEALIQDPCDRTRLDQEFEKTKREGWFWD